MKLVIRAVDGWRSHHMELAACYDGCWREVQFPRRNTNRLALFNRILRDIPFIYDHDDESFSAEEFPEKAGKSLIMLSSLKRIKPDLVLRCRNQTIDKIYEELLVQDFTEKVKKE